jgi:DNA polymerase III alpha subunit/intein/homing endonuclease
VGSSFTHLHVHTEYSMLDGASRLDDLVAAAAADGQPALGITDHGNMYGVLDFYRACRAHGLNPVIGSELYMAHEHRSERPSRRGRVDDSGGETDGGQKLYYHLTALAETDAGYKNLIQLASRAFLEGYYYKPRVDWEVLADHSEGIIATTGCLGGHVLQCLLRGDDRGALEKAARLQDIFGRDNLFVELQDHGIPAQHQTNPKLIDIARRIKAPLLATNDSHYTHRHDHVAHDALLCVQTGSLISDPNRFKFHGDQHYLKSAAEMRQLFAEVPEACDNTLWIAERAQVEIEFGKPQLPDFPVPEGFAGPAEYLCHLTFEGARRRWGHQLPDHVVERLAYELDVIKNMGFSSYFLITWDLIRHARETGIRVGPGRGSAAGCAVAYCLWITDLDPIRYDLLFERFLNPSRVSMPDIDMDFDSRFRDEMIRYAAERYGRDHVAQIVTFSQIKARAAVRDAARVLGYPYAVGDKIAKAMPPLIMGRDTPLKYCFEEHPKYLDGFKMAGELRQMVAEDPDVAAVVEVAKGLEGLRRSDGIHAAAVVITKDPLTTYLPIQRKPENGQDPDDAPVVTQYEMHGVEDLGLLKMDFLGLRNLDVITDTVELIRSVHGTALDIDRLPLDDEPTYRMLRAGQSVGVFQLEGGPMRSLMRSLAPTSFEDIAALMALYRPGPMSANMHNDYADRKNGRKPVTYLHPDAEEILADTYGLCLAGDTVVFDALTGLPTRLDEVPGDGSFLVQGVTADLQTAVRPVTHWVCNGLKAVVRLRAANGAELTGTPDHRVLTDQGWRELGSLRPGDHVAAPAKLVEPPAPSTIDPASLRLLGAVAGGPRSADKRVPRFVFGLDDHQIGQFLGSLWDCDGHVGDRIAFYKTVSPGLAQDVRLLLMRLGFAPVVYESETDGMPAFQVSVYDGARFAALVAPFLACAAKRDASFLAETRGTSIPRAVYVDELLAVSSLSRRALHERFGIPRSGMSGYALDHHPRIRARSTERAREHFELPTVERLLNVNWVEVVSVEVAGEELVYDVTVDEIHNFVANGLVVHNCIYQEAIMRIAQKFAGYSLAEADNLRKACLPAGTLVLSSSRGYVPIERLMSLPDRRVQTIDVTSRASHPEVVDDVWPVGVKPVFRLTTASGHTIEATGDHPFLVGDRWTELSDIRPGDLVAVAARTHTGGGSKLAAAEVDLAARLISERARSWADTTIPSCLVNAPKDDVERFLGRYFCADGWADAAGAHVGSASRAVGAGLKRMLLRCGIQSNLHRRRAAGHGTQWVLSVADEEHARAFAHMVRSHVTRAKGAELRRWLGEGCAGGGATCAGDLAWDTVVSVEPAGDKECFDFRMANPDRPYAVVEDFLVHNCGKKIRELIAAERAKFVEGCDASGYGRQLGEDWFDIIEPFADYAFNKSHSYGYGLISYQTAYLKANYPVEYLACLLTSVKNNLDKAAVYLNECRQLGIKVLVPDINVSERDFTSIPDPAGGQLNAIPFGLSAVRNVGDGLVESILAERRANGPFRSFVDFIERVDYQVLNKRTIESLIKAGAFDSLGHPRKGLLLVFEDLIDKTVAARREHDMGVMTLFGGEASVGPSFDDRPAIPDVEFDKPQRLAFEKEMLGLYVSDHPLLGLGAQLKRRAEATIADLESAEEGSVVTVGGVVTALQRKWTRKGDLMAVFVLEDLTHSAEVMVFPRTMTDYGHLLEDDRVVIVRGRVDKRDDQPKLMAQAVEVFEPVSGADPPLRLQIRPEALSDALIERLKRVLADHGGDAPVYIHLSERQVVRLSDGYCVDTANGLIAELRVMLGADAVF